MNYLYIGAGVATLLYLAYRKFEDYRINQLITKQKAESEEEQRKYNATVSKLEKEIQDAKLTFDINRRKLDSDSNPSK